MSLRHLEARGYVGATMARRFGTVDTGMVAGISIRDMRYAMRHADSRTTRRYDMAKTNLDRHAAAAYLPA